MQLINGTRMAAGYTAGGRPDGRELLVVVVKGTFELPPASAPAGAGPRPAAAQEPLVMTDVFEGEPAFSATVYEADFAPHKPRCDVVLNGSAYAPGGEPATSVAVALQVGGVTKG